MWMPLVPSKVSQIRDVPTLEASGIFLVGMAMRTRTIERYEGTLHV